jgi:L-serine deaminase
LELTNEPINIEYDDIDTAAEDYLYSLVHRILVLIYSPYEKISKYINENNKEKLELLENQVNDHMKYYSRLFNIMKKSVIRIFDKTTEKTRNINKLADSSYKEEPQDNNENQDEETKKVKSLNAELKKKYL